MFSLSKILNSNGESKHRLLSLGYVDQILGNRAALCKAGPFSVSKVTVEAVNLIRMDILP